MTRAAADVLEIATPHGPARAHVHAVGAPRAARRARPRRGRRGRRARPRRRDRRARSPPGVPSRSSSSPTASRGGARRRRRPSSTPRGSRSSRPCGAEPLAGLGVVCGGRSSGARVACRTAAETGAVGVLCLAFPLVPPQRRNATGRPRPARTSSTCRGAGARRPGRERPLRHARCRRRSHRRPRARRPSPGVRSRRGAGGRRRLARRADRPVLTARSAVPSARRHPGLRCPPPDHPGLICWRVAAILDRPRGSRTPPGPRSDCTSWRRSGDRSWGRASRPR